MKILGVDPSLTNCGWGIIESKGSELGFVSAGTVKTSAKETLSVRLLKIHEGLSKAINLYKPDQISIEEIFINMNSKSSIVLAQARGAILLSLAQSGKDVFEYSATNIKKSVVGVGRADKNQIAAMVGILLPKIDIKLDEHGFDALACAITHANHKRW